MLITASVIALLALVFIIGKINLSFQFNKEVRQLFTESNSLAGKSFTYEQLTGLPSPVQCYFKHIMKDGQQFISCARITHTGQFKAGFKKDWINIKGEQYATTEMPGFIWKGTTSIFIARDMFIADKGRLIVSLFSLYNIVDAKGEQYNQAELLRWLGESILYPTNLLPSERLQWFEMNQYQARLEFKYKQFSLFFIITFNEIGEITEMETKRYMDAQNPETWIIKLANYKEMNSILVPTTFEVMWRLKKEDFSYAKFNLEKVEYNIARLFRRTERV